MTLIELSERLSGVTPESIAEETVLEERQSLLEFKRDDWRHGRGASGGSLPEYISPAYAKKKSQMNPWAPYGVWDLRLSGDLYKTIELDISSKLPSVKSPVEYAVYLEKRADPEEIYAFSEEAKQEARAELLFPTAARILSMHSGLNVK